MASQYSPGKLYGMGQLARERGQALEGDGWVAWVRESKIDSVELEYIMDGLEGKPFIIHHRGHIIPFSPFKGQPLSKMKVDYLQYLLGKPWLDNWGTLRLNIEHHLKERLKEQEEAKDILSETIKQLK